MKHMVYGIFIGVFIVNVGVSAQSQSPAKADKVCFVDSIVFAKGVESKEPAGVGKEFESSLGKVYCWTRLSAKTLPVTVKHVWYKGSEKVLEVPLTLKYTSGRFWSNKNIIPGAWKVEVVSETGEVLGSGSFTVK